MIGACQYMTCRSVIGSSFRAQFSFLRENWEPDYRGRVTLGAAKPRLEFAEILLCPEHARLCSSFRYAGELVLTDEGWVYGRTWLDSLGFMA